MTKRDELIALDPAGLEAAVRECARITAPEISDVEYERIKADNSPRYQNTRAEMERTLRAYLNAARSQPNVQPALEAPAAGSNFDGYDVRFHENVLGQLGATTKSDGVESRRHAETGNKSGAVPEAEQSSSATSFVRASGPEDKTLKPRAGVASGPSDPSHEPYEETPFAYAYEYPSYNGPVIRLGTYGREINGSKPIRAIPLYSRPVSLNREEITLAIINSIRKRHSLPAVEWSEIPKSDRTMWLQSGDAVLALIEGRK